MNQAATPKPSAHRRIDALTDRLTDDLADDTGRHPARAHVAEVVEAKAVAFAGARVQDFVPLLTEHQAREALREEGLRRQFPDDAPHTIPVEEAPSPALSPRDR